MALKWLRDRFKHLKIILWAVIAVFVLLVFVDWGTGRRSQSVGGDVAVRIDDRVISQQEFLAELRNTDRQMREVYRDQWDQISGQLNLASQTAQRFIQRELMVQEARKLGLSVSDRELQEEIVAMPLFQSQGGGFVGAETYRRIVRGVMQTTAEGFEAKLREDLLIRKLNAALASSAWVSDVEVEEAIRREREAADLAAILVRYEGFLNQVTADDAAIQAHYQQHSDRYTRDEQRVLRYIAVETGRLRRTLPVEDAEIEAYYGQHQQEFVAGEEARARHVLVQLGPDAGAADGAAAELKAQQVAAQARAGADFAALAAATSDDPGSKERGGDLGWFGRGRMVKEFEDAVFGAQPGAIVGPVKSQFGYHVIKVEEIRQSHQQTLDEVRDRVRAKVVEGRAAAEAELRAAALADRLRAERPDSDEAWQKLADADQATVLNVSPPFASGATIPGIGEDPELSAEVFAAAVGDVGGPRAVPRGWIVWQLKEVRVAGVPALEEVKAQVEQEVRRERAVEMAMSVAQGVAARWRGGDDPNRLAEELKGTVQQVTDHRRGTVIAGIGLAPSLDREIFAATATQVVGPVRLADRGAVVARVDRVSLVDATQLAAERDSYRKRIESQRASQLLEAMLNERRKAAVVTVDNELLERFAPRPRG